MQRILLVKTSSLGDVVHNLPVVSDIARHVPDAVVDWLVEEPFAALPALHPRVNRVITVAVRRWRKALLSRATREEFAAYRQAVGAERYDAVIDTQGLVKSALLARAAGLAPGGVRHGYDAASAREPFAARFYSRHHVVSRDLHAVPRNRQLAAAALGYEIRSGVDGDAVEYGIQAPAGVQAAHTHPAPYAVFLHGTSRADKCWAEERWIALGNALADGGIDAVLPQGLSLIHI